MTRPHRPFWILLSLSLLLLGLLLAVELPLQSGWGGADLDPAALPPTPAGNDPAGHDPAGNDPADSDPPDSDPPDRNPAPDPAATQAAVVERTTVWKILFPYETFSDSLQAGLVDLAVGLATDSLAFGERTLNQLMTLGAGQPGGAPSLFHTLQREVWQITIVLAGVLLPLVLVLSIGSALRSGCMSVPGYVSARDALLQGLLAAASALSSHYLLSRAIDLSGLLSQAILEGIRRSLGQPIQPGHQLLRLLLGGVVYSALPGLARVFLGFTAVLLCAGLVLGLALAFLAREVLLLLAFGLAPLLLVLGALPPLRWLQSLWLKTTVLALLLGPANALLLGISVLVALHANQARLLTGESVIGFLIAAGILSVLLGLNGLLGKTVYGALLEIGHRAWQSTRAVLNLAGFAVGAGIGGNLAAGVGGASLSAGRQAAAGGQAASSSLGRAVGRTVAASGLPGTRGLGTGIQLGSEPDYPLLQQRLHGLLSGSGLQGGFDPQQAVSDAHAGLRAENPGMTALGKSGLPAPALQQRLSAGSALVRSQFEALSALPLSPATALADLGYAGDRSLQEAATRYARSGIARYALGGRGPAPHAPAPAPGRLSGQDLHTALDVVLQLKPDTAAATRISPELLEQVTRSVHQRRTVGRQSLDQIRSSAARVTSLEGLAAWSAREHPAP